VEEFYENEGKNDAVVIALPKGHYLPEFRYASPPSTEGAGAPNSQVAGVPAAVEPKNASEPPLRAVEPIPIWRRLHRMWRHTPLAIRVTIVLFLLGSIGTLIVRLGSRAGVFESISSIAGFGAMGPTQEMRLPGPPAVAASPEHAWGRLFAKATSEGGRFRRISLNQNADFLAISSDGGKIYVASEGSRHLSMVRVADGRVKTISLPRDGGPLLMRPDGRKLYVGSRTQDVFVIDAESGQVTPETIRTPGAVTSLAITPDGQKLFLAMSRKGLWRVLTATGALRQVTSQVCPEYVQIDPSGRNLYVSYQCGGPKARSGHDSVEIFDTETEQSLAIVSGPPLVGGPIAISPDGRVAVVDGTDACTSPDYDHKDCPSVPSHVFQVMRVSDHQIVHSLDMPLDTDLLQFLDSSRLLFGGDSISIMDASQYLRIEQCDHELEVFRSVALDPDRRKAYFGAYHGKEIVVLEAEPTECLPQSDGLISFYTADGVADDPIGAANLTIVGAAKFGPGRVGQGFVLDGKTAFLKAPRTGHYVRFGNRDSSAVLYVKLFSLLGEMTIFERRSDVTPFHAKLSKTPDNRFAFEFETQRGGPLRLVGSTAIGGGRWYQAAITKNDEEIRLYVDGRLEDRKPLGALRSAEGVGDDAPLVLGATRGGKDFLHGELDEILFYNRALNAGEVRRLYEMRESGPCRI